ncbi:hypothetical protein SscP1EGY_13 [Streptomyces phage SscP1EGY]|nr:hypothetical protein SscP1EGY_13 [Streptomyces phage SscP1EGY]
MDVETSVYWRKSYSVEAVKITEENILELEKQLPATEYCNESVGLDTPPVPKLYSEQRGYGYIGDWVVFYAEEFYEFHAEEVFRKKFHSHSEQLSKDEKYAKVFELVTKAMRTQDAATYHGDTTGMDLVAIETTKKILEAL